jgi:hypothetical protein
MNETPNGENAPESAYIVLPPLPRYGSNGGESGDWVALLDDTQPVPIMSLITEQEIDALVDALEEEET